MSKNIPSLLDLHGTLCYLEEILKHEWLCMQNAILIGTFVNFVFQSNGDGLFDLLVIYSPDNDLYTFVHNIGIDKEVFYAEIENNSANCEVYKNFTIDEIGALFMYFKIKSDGLSSAQIDNVYQYSALYSLMRHIFGNKEWNDIQITRQKRSSCDCNRRIYVKYKRHAHRLSSWISQLTNSELKVKVCKNDYEFNLFPEYPCYIDLNLNQIKFFGLCHLIKDRYNRYRYKIKI